ncbi:MAG: hypothetical protein F4Y24_17060 [Gemmatimonadetes bacterium]|nr:hypothetical protein [Gemmatimonadota bacterium]MYJ37299.1 hypothetical protein [Gemmatimonadota bacterium]
MRQIVSRSAVLPLLLCSCDGTGDAEPVTIDIDPDQMAWESPRGDLWDIADVMEKDGLVWVLTSADPLVHGFRGGIEAVAFGRHGDGPNEVRSALALVDRGAMGEITLWDAAARMHRTFSETGTLVSTWDAGRLGTVRGDIDIVTFGDPLRVATTTEGTVRAEYREAVSSAPDLWTGRLARFDDDGGVEHVVDFTELLGAPSDDRSAGSILAPVPLWDVCPDDRIALLDPIARHVYLVGASWETRDSLAVPWEVRPLTRDDRMGYLRGQMEAELQGQQVGPEIQPMLERAEAGSRDQFAPSTPLGVDLRCAAGRVWIQAFDGDSPPLGHGRLWWTISLAGQEPGYTRVTLPGRFRPYRISDSRMLGVVTDTLGLQRVASIELPSALRAGRNQ